MYNILKCTQNESRFDDEIWYYIVNRHSWKNSGNKILVKIHLLMKRVLHYIHFSLTLFISKTLKITQTRTIANADFEDKIEIFVTGCRWKTTNPLAIQSEKILRWSKCWCQCKNDEWWWKPVNNRITYCHAFRQNGVVRLLCAHLFDTFAATIDTAHRESSFRHVTKQRQKKGPQIKCNVLYYVLEPFISVCLCASLVVGSVACLKSQWCEWSEVCICRHMFDYRKETAKLRIYCNPSSKLWVCLGTEKWHTFAAADRQSSHDHATETALI